MRLAFTESRMPYIDRTTVLVSRVFDPTALKWLRETFYHSIKELSWGEEGWVDGEAFQVGAGNYWAVYRPGDAKEPFHFYGAAGHWR